MRSAVVRGLLAERARLAFAAQIAVVDWSRVSGDTPVARLHAAADALGCDPVALRWCLALLPTLRAWVLILDSASGPFSNPLSSEGETRGVARTGGGDPSAGAHA